MAEKQLTKILLYKWNRPYSQMDHYVRVLMAVTMIHVHSLLIRGAGAGATTSSGHLLRPVLPCMIGSINMRGKSYLAHPPSNDGPSSQHS